MMTKMRVLAALLVLVSQTMRAQAQEAAVLEKQVFAPGAESVDLSFGANRVKLGSGSKLLVDWELQNYQTSHHGNEAKRNIRLQDVVHTEQSVQVLFDDPRFAYLKDLKGALTAGTEFNGKFGDVVWKYSDASVEMERKVVSYQDKDYLDVQLHVQFKVPPPKYAFLLVQGLAPTTDDEPRDRMVATWAKGSYESHTLSDKKDIQEFAGPSDWVAVTSRYFTLAVVPGVPASKTLYQPLSSGHVQMGLVWPVEGPVFDLKTKVYFGAKNLHQLRALHPSLDHVVDFGWFTVVAYPILKLMNWIYQYVGNYGIAIILLTLIIKILTFPLTYKGTKSMKQMAKVQPMIQKLKEKYKDDREAQNREMLVLMKTHGYNPMAGCLPILIQMPVFFALYRVLYSAVELYQAPWFFWIKDLSLKDPFYVTPVILTLVMYFQQKLTPNTSMDPVQQKMFQFMPVIFGVFMISLPSGLTLYMLVNALASIVQQIYLNKKFDIHPLAHTGAAK